MPSFNDFIIGGAQFGQSYGAVSDNREMPNRTISQLLTQSWNYGISVIDTAPSYGTSEDILGKDEFQNFDFISKLSIAGTLSPNPSEIRTTLEQSLIRLNKSSLSGYLIHNTKKFLEKTNAQKLWLELCNLKEEGLVQSIGC